MNSNLNPVAERNQQHERRSKLIGGYSAFVAALLVATFAKSGDYPRSWIVISLLALSLPSLVALFLLDFIVLVQSVDREVFFVALPLRSAFFLA
jgi:hypothetical protein